MLLEVVVEVLEREDVLLDVPGEAIDALLERGHLRRRLNLHHLELLLGDDLIDDVGQLRLVRLGVDHVELLAERVADVTDVVLLTRGALLTLLHALSDLPDRPNDEGAKLVGHVLLGRRRRANRALRCLHRVLRDSLALRCRGALWRSAVSRRRSRVSIRRLSRVAEESR